MNQTVYLEKDQVPTFLRSIGGYNGRKFRAVVTTEVTFSGTNWEGGSRDRYTLVRLADSHVGGSFGGSTAPAPWNNPVEGKTVEIPTQHLFAMHTFFQGKDLGLTFYVRPENAAALLPASEEELSTEQKTVLRYTSRYKNSYGGQKNIRFDYAHRETKISQEAWDSAKASLISSGHLRKNGSVTPKGRNAVSD
jgi:hypothetical protein